MEVQGYCTINRNATTGRGSELETFIGKDCRVMEFAQDGGVLVMNAQATAIASFDQVDVYRSFACRAVGDVLCPPDMTDPIAQIMYMTKVTTRKGGYNAMLRNMVIQASLMKGKFTDDLLFQTEREEQAGVSYASTEE
jgi:hypothetical protein